jgi:hypothetical protein
MYGTPQDIRKFSGVTPQDLGLEDDVALDELLNEWLDRISTAIDVRLKEGTSVKSIDNRYKGLVDVCIRTVARMVVIAQQSRSNPIVQLNEFTISTIDTSEVIKNLDKELKPYVRQSARRSNIKIFSSIPEEEQS